MRVPALPANGLSSWRQRLKALPFHQEPSQRNGGEQFELTDRIVGISDVFSGEHRVPNMIERHLCKCFHMAGPRLIALETLMLAPNHTSVPSSA